MSEDQPSGDQDDEWDWGGEALNAEPIGSCDECGCNLYPDGDDYGGLCDQCAWLAMQ